MLEITSLDDIRGNNVVIYSIRNLLKKGNFPSFTILSGHMGVGKTNVAKLVAKELHQSESQVVTVNFGLEVDMKTIEENVFRMNPSSPRAFIFEELHGLDKGKQTALLTMLDSQPSNIYVIATTTELMKVLNTIRSRATVWNFKLLSNRQLAQLLDDYLKIKEVDLSLRARNALVRSAFGVPRDLLKNADLAIAGDFSVDQLEELLGHVSEDLIYTLLCSLKTSGLDFGTSVVTLLGDKSKEKLTQLRDFYTRFLLERKGIEGATISADKLDTLSGLFTDEDLVKIGRTLICATPDTLVLELTLLNMELTGTSKRQLVGQQIDRAAQNNAESTATHPTEEIKGRISKTKVNRSNLSELTLD